MAKASAKGGSTVRPVRSGSPANKVDLAKRSHPLYDEYRPKWDFYLQSVKGGSNYTEDEGNLFTHRLESSSDDYADRQTRAYYLNYCAEIPNIYANYIFKEIVKRPVDIALEEFRADVDGKGTTIEAFMKKVSLLSSIFGHIHIVVDTPAITAEEKAAGLTEQAAKAKGLRPYASVVYPQFLKDWSVDSKGKLVWVLIEQRGYADLDPLVERQEEVKYKIITRNNWMVYDKDSKLIEEGTNPLGEVFMITCYNKDVDLDLIGESILSDIAYINRAIFNWCSNIDEMIERQTFSQLVCPDDGTLSEQDENTDPLKKIGSSTIFTFPADTGHPPTFISPDTNQMKVIWEMIRAHVDEIWRLASLKGNDQGMAISQRSGISMQMAFLDVNSAFAAKAHYLEVAENELTRLAYAWLGKKDTIPERINYPNTFDVLSLADSIDTTFKVCEANFSEVLNKELLKQLARKVLPIAPEGIKVDIENEIDSGDGLLEKLRVARQQAEAQQEALEVAAKQKQQGVNKDGMQGKGNQGKGK